MDEIQAAFLSIKLKHLDKETEHRRSIAKYYTRHLTNKNIDLPQVPTHSYEHVWHLYVLRTENRNELQEYLTKKGVQTLIHYPIPPHKQQAYKLYNHLKFPVTEKIHKELLTLPLSSVVPISEISDIINIINKY